MMKSIVLPLDGSPLADQAVPFAVSLARRSGARIILVRATEARTILDVDASDAQRGVISRAEHDLEAAAARLRTEGVEAEVHVYYDTPVPAILDASRRYHASLIVMSTHGRSGLGRMMYGSVADDILRHADAPVLLIPSTIDHAWAADWPPTILVPLDGSALAEEALGGAEMLAELLGARLHLLRVVEPARYPLYGDGYAFIPFDDAAEQELAREYLNTLAGRLASSGTQVQFEVAVGIPSAVIPSVARECHADTIAMATHGRGGLARLVLGSVATGTLQRTHVPLLLTRPAALEQPVSEPPTPASDAPTISLTLTPCEVVRVQAAIEAMLLSSPPTEHGAEPLRAVLSRLRATAQTTTPQTATPACREAIGAPG
jgi:nucleotide-binding universal stress UspA family protein